MMKNKSLILLFVLIFSSCTNLLHVEKRQYRKGFHIENLLALNKHKNVLLALEDTAIKQLYYQNDSITSEEEVIREDIVGLADNDSLFAETELETLYYLPIADMRNIEKIKDEDPDDEEKKVKPNNFDIISSVLGLITVSSYGVLWLLVYIFYDVSGFFPVVPFLIFIFGIALTVLFFLTGRTIDIIQKKEKNKLWNKRAWITFILTILVTSIHILILL